MESSFSSVRQAAATWWLYALGGVGLFLLGLWVFNSPGSAFLGLSLYFAVAIAFSGVASILFAFGNRARLPNWGWLAALGLAEVLLGCYLLAVPVAAASVLVFIIGGWLLLRSISIVSKAFVLRRLGYAKWGWTLAMGLLGVVLALVVIGNPVVGVLGVTTWLAVALLVLGIAAVVLGLRLRRAAHHG